MHIRIALIFLIAMMVFTVAVWAERHFHSVWVGVGVAIIGAVLITVKEIRESRLNRKEMNGKE